MKLWWGDLHVHSVFSPDAEGEVDELYHLGRDVAALDFMAVADNDFYPSKMLLDSEIHYTAEMAASLTQPGRFLALSAFEWTFHRPDAARSFNHRITLFPPDGRRIARRNEPSGRSQAAFRAFLQETGYFSFPHHAHWRLLGAPGEWAVEVTAAWGTYILDSPTVFAALNAGRRFGFLGNSDSHRFLPGLSGALTGVYATELSRESIMEALRARRCFATTGNRTALALWVDDGFMGQVIPAARAPVVRWQVWSQGALASVEIIRNGVRVHCSQAAVGEWTDNHAPAGGKWYILQVREQGRQRRYPHNVAPAWGKWAWSSPVWVEGGGAGAGETE